MKIEHVAFNVSNPEELMHWLAEHMDMEIVRKFDNEFRTCFLADSERETMLELYNNPSAPTPDYASLSALVVHIAFTVDDVPKVRERLLAAGGTADGEVVTTPDGDELCMVRAPGGMAIQLMKRAEPMMD